MKVSLTLSDSTKNGKPYYDNIFTIDTETGEGECTVKFQGQTSQRDFVLIDNSLWEEVLVAFLYKDGKIGKLVQWAEEDVDAAPVA